MDQTAQIIVVAEVYQSDISKIELGQTATITSQAFQGELKGMVSQIGREVKQQNVFSNQPGENLDRRIVEVKIRLTRENSQQVAGLTNLQVQTEIDLSAIATISAGRELRFSDRMGRRRDCLMNFSTNRFLLIHSMTINSFKRTPLAWKQLMKEKTRFLVASRRHWFCRHASFFST